MNQVAVPYVPPAVLADSRPATFWRLHRPSIEAAVRHFAPTVERAGFVRWSVAHRRTCGDLLTATAGAARRQSREVKVARKRCGVTTPALSKQMTSTSAFVVYVHGWVRWQ